MHITARSPHPCTSSPALAQPAPDRAPPQDRYADPRHWQEVARRAQKQGDVDLALQAWMHLDKLMPGTPEVQFHLACCLSLQQEPGRACRAFSALADRADAPPALRQRAARLAALLHPDSRAEVASG